MQCINCGVATQRLRRHISSSLPAVLLTILARWLTIEVPRDANICHPCYELLNSDTTDVRLFGHTMVCIICGRSVKSIRRHVVESNDSMLQNFPMSHQAFHQAVNYACHPCWTRHQRQTNQPEPRARPKRAPRPIPEPEIELPNSKWAANTSRHYSEEILVPDLSDDDLSSNSVGSFEILQQLFSDKQSNDKTESVTETETQNETDKYEELLKNLQSLDIIYNVYKYLSEEYNTIKSCLSQNVLDALTDVVGRTASATGVSRETVQYVLEIKDWNNHVTEVILSEHDYYKIDREMTVDEEVIIKNELEYFSETQEEAITMKYEVSDEQNIIEMTVDEDVIINNELEYFSETEEEAITMKYEVSDEQNIMYYTNNKVTLQPYIEIEQELCSYVDKPSCLDITLLKPRLENKYINTGLEKIQVKEEPDDDEVTDLPDSGDQFNLEDT